MNINKMWASSLVLITILLAFTPPTIAWSCHIGDGCLTSVEDLHFGTFGLSDNDAAYTIVLAADNTFVNSPQIIIGTDPQRGEYLIENLPPFTAPAIVITDTTINNGGNPPFSIDNYTHNNPVTDAGGNATFLLGGTLTTTGTTAYYATGTYSGTMDITFTF